ncbi:MAG: transposase [Anaerolineae bacterium]
MNTQVILLPPPFATGFAPLAVLGYCLTRTEFLKPLCGVQLGIKTRQHAPHEKLQDVLVSILANCSSIKQIDLRIRPDLVLAEAWGRTQFAEQSTTADTLNAFTDTSVAQLRTALDIIYQREGQACQHNFETDLLAIDIDLTGLRASARAEGSCKGYFSGKRNAHGRQVIRVSAPYYHETLYSKLAVGSQHGSTVLKATLRAVQSLLHWTPEQGRRVLIRTDAGLGSDTNINWALTHNYQVLMKGYNGKRAIAFAKQINAADWYALHDQRWVACVPQAPRYARRTQTLVLHWVTESGETKYATLVHSLLDHDWHTIPDLYDGRGAVESEIKMDKSGLLLPKRRKQQFAAQETLLLVTDLAHNLLAWLHPWMFAETRFAKMGPVTLVNDVLCLPGEIRVKGDKLHMVALWETHPYAAEMQVCLLKLLAHFGNP